MSKDASLPLLKSAVAGIDPATGVDPSLPQDIPGNHAMIHQMLVLTDGLQQQVRQLQRMAYGKSSEKLFPEVAATPTTAPVAPEAVKKTKVTPHGRGVLPPELPRERIEHDLTEQQKPCPCCGKMRQCIGQEVTERLEYVPAKLKVLQDVRFKYGCCECETQGLNPQIELAEKPANAIEKGLAGPGLLAHVIVSKYADHLPLNRLENILGRHKIEIARSTMCDWTAQSAEALEPLYKLMIKDVKESKVLHSDDTPVDVQDSKLKHQTRTGRFWVYVGDKHHPLTVFNYTSDRSQSGPLAFLAGWSGYLQADACASYNPVYAGEAGGQVIEVACWAHARRKFFEARETHVAVGTQALGQIRLLYDVEDVANQQYQAQKDNPDARSLSAIRLELRQQLALPRLQQFKLWLESQQVGSGGPVMAKSAMGKAITYVLNQWDALCVYTSDGDLNIDNNTAENALRRIAIGRNNWTFLGSDAGGKTAAIHFSLIASCQRQGVNPFEYLKDVISRIVSTPMSKLAELLPDRWKPRPAELPPQP